jgi:single-stranded-DNA-specific exonuclease
MDSSLTRARAFLGTATVVPHTDADGLAAGAMALRATGRTADDALLFGRGGSPFASDASSTQGALALLDWGVRDIAAPALFVDHHAPEATPRHDQLVVSGYEEDPPVSTSVLMRRILPDQPAWLAAVGAYGDLGAAGLRLPECTGTARTALARLVPLVNAPRRVPGGPVREVLRLLVESSSVVAALEDPRAQLLRRCKEEWQRAFDHALKTAPRVRDGTALIRFSSPYQVHPVVATAWERRLAPKLVVAANDGYLPDRVNFAVRGGVGDLRRVLREALPDAGGEFAHGHDRATGGSVDPDTFERLLSGLGFR